MPSVPRDLAPMLASRAEEAFDSDQYVFELKWGGIRALAHIDQARLTLVSQSGRDITAWFPELAGIAAQVKRDGVVLDGEIVALGADGVPDLGLITGRLCGGAADDGTVCLYQAYDLLYAGGLSFMERPLLSRKESLARLLPEPGPAVKVDCVPDEGLALFEAAAERRLPGIVAKAKRSIYKAGRRSTEWLDIQVYESGWFVVGGYALGLRKEDRIAGLLIGEPVGRNRLTYAATLEGNLPGRLLESVLTPLASEDCPFVTTPPLMRLVYWLRPELVCEVRFARRAADGHLRFPVFVTMRPDLSAKDLAEPPRGGLRAPGR